MTQEKLIKVKLYLKENYYFVSILERRQNTKLLKEDKARTRLRGSPPKKTDPAISNHMQSNNKEEGKLLQSKPS